jgi:SAM-dependent methyltransferase
MVIDRAYLRRRRESGWRPSYRTGRIDYESARSRGQTQLARITRKLERYTGVSLDSRRALDFGCGWGRIALPLAERCAHVYGVDISPRVLQEAQRNAAESNVTNVEWLATERLPELQGRYDLVISTLVFQHIPVREGERLFAALLRGLAPGGIGAINVVLRPSRPWRGVASWVKSSRSLKGSGHMLKGSYALDRLARLLADEGIGEWCVDFANDGISPPFLSAIIMFAKRGAGEARADAQNNSSRT